MLHEQPRPRGRRATPTTWSSTAAPAGPRATGRRSTRSCARCARSRPTRRCSCSRASRSASCARTSGRRACSSPTATSCRDWATWPEFRRLEHLGLTMYGQMTAGSWIYIGTQGIVQGTYETFAAVAEKRFGGTLARHAHRHRRVRRHGRRAAARGHDERRRRARRRRRPVAPRAPRARPLPRRVDERPRRRASSACSPPSASGGRSRSGSRATAPYVLPELLRRGIEVDIVTDQTSAHDPLAYLPLGVTRRGLARRTPSATRRASPSAPASRWPRTSRRWSASWTPAPRSSTTATRSAPRPSSAATPAPGTFPGFVPAYIRPLFCEGKGPFRWAALSGDPADIAATDQAVLELFPDNEPLHRWITPGAARRSRSRACPRASAGSATASATRPALRFNEMVADGTLKAPDRHRPRPPRLRQRRLALPRDRGDARRLRRHRRLAAAQRARQHRVRRDVGLDPPRRRRRHRPLDPRRPGHRRRRHAARRREDRARAHQRPRHGRHPPRRRRLRARRSRSPTSAACASRCARATARR